MNLSAYPRPPGDTGLGIHWSAGPAGAVPMQDLRQRWLPELRAMDIKWVKCLHDGAEGLVQELLANDIMPIVRLYRHRPNPGRLDQELKNRVKRFVSLGVRYFEVNNEPNLKEEWQPGEWENAGDRLPEIVVDHWIADAEYVLAEGGLPAFPAPTPGGHWDDVDFFVKALRAVGERGRDDLFEEGAWLAIHNYFLNHPSDYPYDEVNQFGVPVSDTVARNHSFRRPIPEVNQERQQGAVPGRTLAGDSNGFLKYRLYRDLFVEHFGFEVPLLTTEGGVVMNRAQDPRYPIIDQELHREYNLFGFTHMVDAPNCYFCNCPWLIANAQMNHHNEHWEDNAWYSDRWQGGHLPIVTAVKERSPWPVRRLDGPAGTLNITVESGAGQVVILRRSPGDAFVADGDINQQDTTAITGLRAGTYTAHVAGTSQESAPVTVSEGGTATISMEVPPRMSAIVGQVVNPPDNAIAQLFILDSESGDARLRRQIPVSGGHFRFDGLSAGRYRIGLANRPGVTAGPVELDGRDTEHVTLSVPRQEWEFTIVENTSGDSSTQERRSIVQLIAPALRGRTIQLHAPWAVISERIGNKPEINPDAAVVDSLPAGTYRISVQGIPGEVQFSLDGRGTAKIRLAQVEVPVEADTSRVVGQLTDVPASASLPTLVRLVRDGAQVAETQTDATGKFVFEGLAAGTYVVRVPAFKLQSTSFSLDGKNAISFKLQVPAQAPPAQSRIRAVLRNAPTLPADVILLRAGTQIAETQTDAEGIFVFEELQAGTYVVRVPAFDLESTPITLDGTNEQRFQLRVPDVPTTPVEPPEESTPPDEPAAATSTIRGHIAGGGGQPIAVELSADGIVITETETTASGDFVFRSLPAGTYIVRVPAFDVASSRIELDGTNDETVQLRVGASSPAHGEPGEPALQTYIWLVPGQLDAASLYLLVLPLVEKTGWAFGRSRAAAESAGAVIVIGGAQPEDTDAISMRTSIVNRDPLILAAELASFEATV